jgi:Fic family protein
MIAAAAAHHRLMWIHPFLDGNGRVARLFTDAYLRLILMEGYGLWTVSRGLARQRNDYMSSLTWADAPRRHDYNGRGNLSNDGLIHFCDFFLKICLDQIEFMSQQLQLDSLLARLRGYVQLRHTQTIPPLTSQYPSLKTQAADLLQAVLLRGELTRGEAARATQLPERTARTVMKQLLDERLLVSETPKGRVKIGIPAAVATYWFPELYPERNPLS